MKQPVFVYLNLLIQPFSLYMYPSVECLCGSNGSDGLERVFVTFHQDSSVRSENVMEEKRQIKALVDLKWWIDDYCAAMKKRDPTSPQIKVILDAEPKPSYGRRLKVYLPHFFTPTYCISSTPDSSPAYSYGARIYNHMFSSRPVTVELTSCLLEEPVPDLEAPYRKGYFGAGKSNWDTAPKPFQSDKATALTRRQNAQTVALPQGADVTYNVQMDDVDMRQEIEKKKGTPGQAQAAERSSKADVAKQSFCPPSSCSSN